jgi:hypothetical protein
MRFALLIKTLMHCMFDCRRVRSLMPTIVAVAASFACYMPDCICQLSRARGDSRLTFFHVLRQLFQRHALCTESVGSSHADHVDVVRYCDLGCFGRVNFKVCCM